jgi:hypothetical protein
MAIGLGLILAIVRFASTVRLAVTIIDTLNPTETHETFRNRRW